MSKAIKSQYRAGDEAEAGVKIGTIIGSNEWFIVYIEDDTGTVFWEISDGKEPKHMNQSLCRFNVIMNLIEVEIAKPKQFTYRYSNGRALFSSMTSCVVKETVDAFDPLEERILLEIQTRGRIAYVASASGIALFSCIVGFVIFDYKVYPAYNPFIMGTCMGMLGALLSVYQRSQDLEIGPNSTRSELVFNGVSRIILGAISGFLTVVVVHADLMIGFAERSLPALSVFAALSGFSERYFPNILNQIEADGGKRDENEKEIEG